MEICASAFLRGIGGGADFFVAKSRRTEERPGPEVVLREDAGGKCVFSESALRAWLRWEPGLVSGVKRTCFIAGFSGCGGGRGHLVGWVGAKETRFAALAGGLRASADGWVCCEAQKGQGMLDVCDAGAFTKGQRGSRGEARTFVRRGECVSRLLGRERGRE